MARLFTDHHFHIGDPHLTAGKPCQDYAISGVYNNAGFAIVSDGCSSGGHTDVGSRVLALSTLVALREHWARSNNDLGQDVTQEISFHQRIKSVAAREILGLQHSDMLATSFYAYITPDGGFISLHGDGVVALKYQNGNIQMSRYEWADETPFYPVYNEPSLMNGFIQLHGGDLDAIRLTEEVWLYNGQFTKQDSRELTLAQGITGIDTPVSKESLLEGLEFIAIFSDGITRINGIDWKEAVVKFLAFKNTTGAFAKRRMIRVINDHKKGGGKILDDISYAVVGVEIKESEVS